jgi:hypothetical protein
MFHGSLQYVTRYFSTGKAIKNITDGCDVVVRRLTSTVTQRISKKIFVISLFMLKRLSLMPVMEQKLLII